MRVLSLFSGGGLGDYGLTLAGMEIVGQVEIDEYCQKILSLRWPEVPKWRDIRDVKGAEVIERCGRIDVVSGGFPCQPFSVAGKRRGENDERDLWKEMFRVICEIKPRWVLGENVPGLLSISNGWKFGEVLRDLASVGYCVEWDCVPASAVGSPHQRDRVWIVAYSPSVRCNERFSCWEERHLLRNKNRKSSEGESEQQGRLSWVGQICSVLSHSQCTRPQGKPQCEDRFNSSFVWPAEPPVCRVVDGATVELERLRLLGNGQVVQVVEWIGKRIMEYESRTEPKL